MLPTDPTFFLGTREPQPSAPTACRFKSKREWHGIRKANDGSMKKTGPSIIHMTLDGMSWMDGKDIPFPTTFLDGAKTMYK